MTGTPDGNLHAPAPEVGAAAAKPAAGPPAMSQPRRRLVVTLPGEIDATDDGQVRDTLTLDGDIDEETYPGLVAALGRLPGTEPVCMSTCPL